MTFNFFTILIFSDSVEPRITSITLLRLHDLYSLSNKFKSILFAENMHTTILKLLIQEKVLHHLNFNFISEKKTLN